MLITCSNPRTKVELIELIVVYLIRDYESYIQVALLLAKTKHTSLLRVPLRYLLYSLSEKFDWRVLPTHQLLPQVLIWYAPQSFSKDIAKLLLGFNFNETNRGIRRDNVFSEPVIFDCIMFRTRSHSARF